MTDHADLLTRADAEARNINLPKSAQVLLAELAAALREDEREHGSRAPGLARRAGDVIGGFPHAEPTCRGCGVPLTLENAWMTDGCPCNSPLGINNLNETRWRLLMELQQQQSRSLERLEQQLRGQSKARERLEDVIRDIDAHATPIGLLDANDPEGSPAYYAVTVGALHRALGKSGTAPKCPAPEVVAALDEFVKEMQERVIPDIVRAVAERQVLANEARQRILLPKEEAV